MAFSKVCGLDVSGGAGGGWDSDIAVTDKYVKPGWCHGSVAGSISSGNLCYTPIYVYSSTTYERIGIYVTAAGGVGSLARLGIYEDNGGVPGDLVLDAGTVSIASTGHKLITINQTLQGKYWLAYVADDTASLNIADRTRVSTSPVQGENEDIDGLMYPTFYVSGQSAQVAAGLDDPATAPTTLSVSTMRVGLREA